MDVGMGVGVGPLCAEEEEEEEEGEPDEQPSGSTINPSNTTRENSDDKLRRFIVPVCSLLS